MSDESKQDFERVGADARELDHDTRVAIGSAGRAIVSKLNAIIESINEHIRGDSSVALEDVSRSLAAAKADAEHMANVLPGAEPTPNTPVQPGPGSVPAASPQDDTFDPAEPTPDISTDADNTEYADAANHPDETLPPDPQPAV